MSFVASALRPCLSGQEEKVRKVRGLEDWRDVPPANYLLKPRERQLVIEAPELGLRISFLYIFSSNIEYNVI